MAVFNAPIEIFNFSTFSTFSFSRSVRLPLISALVVHVM
jgi:hypothetical protein